MRIGRSSLVVLGIIFAVLVAFSCGDDDDDPDTPTPSASSPSLTSDGLGGPYQLKKLADFLFYSDKGLSFSEVEILDETLLMKSINANNVPPYGDQEQLYNFAITSDGKIHVGVWKADAMGGIARIQNTQPAICEEETSRLPEDAFEAALADGFMINLLPENLLKRSPCSLTTGDGLLDALSKHFMLAQDVGTRIDDYVEDDWLGKRVAYAGEIIVNVGECTYEVNNQSGTYQPKDSDEIREQLAGYFDSELLVAPTKVNEKDVPDISTVNTVIPDVGC